MATIIERLSKDGKPRYTVQIRLRGAKPITKTFTTKTAAKSYVQAMESDIRRGAHVPAQEAQRHSLSEAIDRYILAVLPTKRESTADAWQSLESADQSQLPRPLQFPIYRTAESQWIREAVPEQPAVQEIRYSESLVGVPRSASPVMGMEARWIRPSRLKRAVQGKMPRTRNVGKNALEL